jgi:hypothetical protein
MNDALVSLLVAAIGLASGLLGAYVAGRQQARLEEAKWRAARQDELDKEKRIAVAELCRKIVVMVQSAQWLAWYAKHQPSRISDVDMKEYDKKTSQLLPDIMSSLVIVSALDSHKFTLMSQIVSEVIILDEKISKAMIQLASSRDEGIEAMANCLPDFIFFWDSLNRTVADMFDTPSLVHPSYNSRSKK